MHSIAVRQINVLFNINWTFTEKNWYSIIIFLKWLIFASSYGKCLLNYYAYFII